MNYKDAIKIFIETHEHQLDRTILVLVLWELVKRL